MLVVFCPFAAGYYLSYFYRYVNAVIAKDLVRDFGIVPADLGLLTGAYFLSFAAAQLPLGVALDRFGPRRCTATLFCVAAAGALTFGLARDLTTLSTGRALIGLGVSAGLMGSIKAFTLWFPRERLTRLSGWMIGIGSLGTLTATAPVQALLGPFGWRALFVGLAILSLAAALLIFFVVPERALPGQREGWREQFRMVGRIFARFDFWRLAAPLVLCQASFQSLQGLWFAPWLADVHGLDRASTADYLFASAAAYMVASVSLGAIGDAAARRGVSPLRFYKAGMLICAAVFAPLAFGAGPALLLLMTYAATSISTIIAYTLLTQLVPASQTGRVTTASNLLLFATSFVFQWGVGAILGLWPSADGRYDPEGYRVALGVLLAAQAAAAAWLLTAREARL
jgi:sugar phosphate permease